ncbi:MAG TPA: ParB/RepB/Spo0J family partition protein [Acidimicrobiia bacterium]|jgi:ParB family chromosome partitioning protein|nr:ParB/RepB/Spo0J family partition protein [Acidimicrobiia bacterium]
MTARKSGLGRGLESLIPVEGPQTGTPDFAQIPIESIKPNPSQPRRQFDESAIEELAASIAAVGVLQPLVVTPDEGEYVLIAGERRWRAAKKAGLTTVPAVIRGSSPSSSLVEALVENLQRQDLSPLEEAHAFRQLMEDFGMSQEEVAKKVGKSRPAVSNTIRLLQLPGPIQSMVDSGKLSAGHARALVGLEDGRYALYLAERAINEGWSVRQMEDAVKSRREMEIPGNNAPGVREIRPVQIIELERRLADHLGARVKINYRNEKGKVEIRFGSVEELERIYRLMA